MTAQIVRLSEKPDRIWVCAHCGCVHFELHEDGTTECASCSFRGEPGHWHENVTEATTPEPPGLRQNVSHGTADFAKASILKHAKDADCVALVVLKKDGTIKAWGDVDKDPTDNQRRWIHESMAISATLLLGEPPPERTVDHE